MVAAAKRGRRPIERSQKVTMSPNRPTVLILTSDPIFSREITAQWPPDPASQAPEFVVLEESLSRDLKASHYDLAIADASCCEKRSVPVSALKLSLAAAGKPAIMIHSNATFDLSLSGFYKLDGAILELHGEELHGKELHGEELPCEPKLWPAMAALLGREILLRRQAESVAREAESNCAAAQGDATLGRYIVEMRTNINNALTTVLGNAELLALEPGLPGTVQAQADTIRNMALRLHEIFRRFFSIEKELKVAAREDGKKSAHAVAGSS